MTSLYTLAIASLAWIVWVPAAGLEKRARGDTGGVSIFPAIPFFPLIAWALAYGLDRLYQHLGLVLVGGGHAVFLAALVISIFRSSRKMRQAKKEP